MTFILYTNSISAHQLPLAREIARLVGVENFRYVYEKESVKGNQRVDADDTWIVKRSEMDDFRSRSDSNLLDTCDVLLVGGLRPIELIERRLAVGKVTFFMSERWFKPFDVGVGHRCRCSVPGWLRLFHPGYFKMAKRFAKLFNSPCYRFLPIGPWSAHDMCLIDRIMSFLHLRLRPTPAFIPWGDFVAPSTPTPTPTPTPTTYTSKRALRVLWVGRMLDWKCVDTLIHAIAYANEKSRHSSTPTPTSYTLTLVGDGPEKSYLEKLASTLHLHPTPTPNLHLPLTPIPTLITFLPPVSLHEVRTLMRTHDVYILPSNAYEGWGAVVLEALTEGMDVIGTFEAGASAALLPKENLFHCDDWCECAKILVNHEYRHIELPYEYTPKGAAERLLREAEKIGVGCRCRCRV